MAPGEGTQVGGLSRGVVQHMRCVVESFSPVPLPYHTVIRQEHHRPTVSAAAVDTVTVRRLTGRDHSRPTYGLHYREVGSFRHLSHVIERSHDMVHAVNNFYLTPSPIAHVISSLLATSSRQLPCETTLFTITGLSDDNPN